jgi:hypothetical protein
MLRHSHLQFQQHLPLTGKFSQPQIRPCLNFPEGASTRRQPQRKYRIVVFF